MTSFNRDIQQFVQDNTLFRQELLATAYSQLVIMRVETGDDIGEEVHAVDQVLVFVSGQGEAVLNGERSPVKPNSLVVVPAGTTHNFSNTGQEPLKLFTVYAPRGATRYRAPHQGGSRGSQSPRAVMLS